MAFDKTPTTWITSYSANATHMTLPLSSYPDILAAAANTTTGDIREIYQGMCEQMYSAYNTKRVANVADIPNKMTLTKSVSVDTQTNKTTLNYNMTFVCDSGTTFNVANET